MLRKNTLPHTAEACKLPAMTRTRYEVNKEQIPSRTGLCLTPLISPEDYENLFLSATYGAAPFDLKFPGLSQGGMGVSVFWTPTGSKARGFKMGPIASTGIVTSSGSVSWYKRGGPFSMGQEMGKWLNDNIPAPNLTNTQDVDNLINSIKEKLNKLRNPLPQY